MEQASPAPSASVTAAPSAVMSAVAAKAFATPPVQQPQVPPTALPEAPEQTEAEPQQASAPAGATVLDVVEGDTEVVDGVACPVDPMERLQCESCQ